MKTPNKRLLKLGKFYVWFQPFSIWFGAAYVNIGNGNWCIDFYLPLLHLSWLNIKDPNA